MGKETEGITEVKVVEVVQVEDEVKEDVALSKTDILVKDLLENPKKVALLNENIPTFLKSLQIWVGFNNKKPINANLTTSIHSVKYAKSNEPNTWCTYEKALNLVNLGICDSVGLALREEDSIICVDVDCHLDRCTSEEEKQLMLDKYEEAFNLIKNLPTYIEKSISGKGVHLYFKGNLSEGFKNASNKLPIEIYSKNHFVIATGDKINDFDISEDKVVLDKLIEIQAMYFDKKDVIVKKSENNIVPIIHSPIRADEEVLELVRKDTKASLLYNDKWMYVKDSKNEQRYAFQHFADKALIDKLTFYTANCPSQVERLFRGSPTFLAYGKNGKYVKNEPDITNNIAKSSAECSMVYDSKYYKTTTSNSIISSNSSTTLPDFNLKIVSEVVQNLFRLPLKQSLQFKNTILNYIDKYKDKSPIYLDNLYKQDYNVNGLSNIVKTCYQNNLKFSQFLNNYIAWDGQLYKETNKNIVIHYITLALENVEHSAMKHLVEEILDNDYFIKYSRNDEGEEEIEDYKMEAYRHFEKYALSLLKSSKSIVTIKNANDILVKYVGLTEQNDVKGYYESPFINMQNGVLNLETKEFWQHHQMFNMYKITNSNYILNAECPNFLDMLKRILPNEADRKEFQKVVGLTLAKSQLPAKKVLVLLVGPKDTGKTTLLNILSHVLGDYSSAISSSLLMETKKDKTVGPEMGDLRETLMITASETNANDSINTSTIKALTGNTTISVRNNYATEMIKFKMIGIIFIDSNNMPIIPSVELATWDRIRLFEFNNVITEKDSDLIAKLENESSGIFNWILEGLELVLKEKTINETESMLKFKDKTKDDLDIVKQFANECFKSVKNDSLKLVRGNVHTIYRNWSLDSGLLEMPRNKFYDEFGRQYESKKSGSVYFTNIEMTRLGYLYSHMKELSPGVFSIIKKYILENNTIPDDVLKKYNLEDFNF